MLYELIQVPVELLNYNNLKSLEPNKDCYIKKYNKISCKYIKEKVNRKYKSYGVSPKFNPKTKKSYMFTEKTKGVPLLLKPLLGMAKAIDPRFNNVYVNWYDSGDNDIKPHSDCTAGMVEDSKILIVNVNEGNYERIFNLATKTGDMFDSIVLENGLGILLDSREQEHYRHWVPVSTTKEGRISVTFRMIKE